MNYFEYLMSQHDLYVEIARIYAEADDVNMAQFYYNAAYGYELKAKKLPVAVLSDPYKW